MSVAEAPPALPAGGGTREPSRVRTAALVVAAVLAGVVLLVLHIAVASAGVSPLVLVLLDSLPFLFLLARKPVLRRLAVRNSLRRPRETVLVLVGSMLGTAIITGSFIVGDTLDGSIRAGAFTRLGPVDELIGATSRAGVEDLDQAVRRLPPALVDGTLPITTARVTAAKGAERAEPSALLVEVDFDRARALGGDAEVSGIEGATPQAGEVVLGRDLAATLDAKVGSSVDVFAYGARRPLRVSRVLDRRGVAGLLDPGASFAGGSRAPNLFVAPGTAEQLAAGSAAAPPSFVLAVSNRGGVLEGAATTPQVLSALRGVLPADTTVRPVKGDLVDAATQNGRQFTQLFTSIGFFSVLAGVLLLVNIFTALAQERKVSLGMLRAIGLRRASLVASFSLEGWIYALGSALLGALVGIGVGRAIILVAADIFSTGSDEDFTLDLRFTFDSSSLTGGFTIGFAISLVTVLLSSLVLAKLNVIRAIRDLPEPPRTKKQRVVSRVFGVLLALAGAALTASGLSGEQPETALAGPAVLCLGLGMALTSLLPSRLATTLAAAATIAWGVLCFGLFPDVFDAAEVPVFALQGVILVSAAVAILVVNLEAIGGAIRRLGGGASAMSLRLGLAYPLARRFRAGAILAMYAMVVFILTFILVLGSLFASQAERFTRDSAGAFDVQVTSNETNPVPAAEVRTIPGVVAVSEQAVTSAQFDVPGFSEGFEDWPVGGFDRVLAERGPPGLGEWDKVRYPDEADVWKAVADDPNLIIITEFFLQTGGGGPPQPVADPGSTVTMRDPQTGRTRRLTVAAVADGSFTSFHVHVSRRTLDELAGPRAVSNVLYVATADEATARRIGPEINARYLASGADAVTFRSIVQEQLAGQTSFFRLMQGYIALGLVVGIAGLGVVMVRAVRERRRQVGVLRSLGFQAAQVRRAFLVESGFIALLGVLTGTLLAVIVAWRLIGTDAFGDDLPFSLPWGQLALVIGLTFVFSLLATAAPAQQASTIRPAVALRTTD